MNGNHHKEWALACEAAEWLDKLEERGTEAHAAFAEWITASPLHIKAFLNLTSVNRLLDGIDPHKLIEVDQLIAKNASVVPLRDAAIVPSSTRPVTATRRVRWAIAAAVALMTFASWWAVLYFHAKQTYATVPGEQRAVQLVDGSTVNLNTGSRIKLHFSSDVREIFLDGEAMFKVRKDPNRPFRVHSGNAIIQAVGTQFNVHGRPSGTIVSVLEGIVQVSPTSATASSAPRQLTVGEEALISRDGRIERRAMAQTAGVDAWRQHRLVFEDDRLDDIAAEFNRWNRAQIRIEGAELASRLYSGAFNADDPGSLIAFLRQDKRLEFETQEQALIIRTRNE